MPKHIEDIGWEELTTYQFFAGFDNITVISDAPKATLVSLFEAYAEEPDNILFAEFIRQRGFNAVQART